MVVSSSRRTRSFGCDRDDGDGDGTMTEVFWGALHGISLLERAGRLRPEHRAERVAELSARFGTGSTPVHSQRFRG